MNEVIRYEPLGDGQYQAQFGDGRTSVVSSTFERAYPGLVAPDGAPRGAHHQDLYAWSIRQLTQDAREVADIACGAGYGTYAIRQTGRGCIGVDISGEAVAYARARYGDPFVCADAAGLIVLVDAIVSVETIEHIADDVGTLRRWASARQLIITTPIWDGKAPLLSEHHVREYTPAQLFALCAVAGWRVVSHEYPIGERKLHQGIVAVRP